MKLSISYLRQIIQEESEAELLEKKKKKQQKDKMIKAQPHFNSAQSRAEADKTFHNCIVSVKSDPNLEPWPGTNKETAAARICTDDRKDKGATLDWSAKRRREVEKARPGGLTGKEQPLPKIAENIINLRKNKNED